MAVPAGVGIAAIRASHASGLACNYICFTVSSLTFLLRTQADPQDFERMLMVKPLFTVRDLSWEDDPGNEEMLRNYAFNISQGIVQRVSRFFDALALMDERGVAPPDYLRGGVIGFGNKHNVYNQETVGKKR